MLRAGAVLLIASSLACGCEAAPYVPAVDYAPPSTDAMNSASGPTRLADGGPESAAIGQTPGKIPAPGGPLPSDNNAHTGSRELAGGEPDPPSASNNVMIGVAGRSAAVERQQDETFYINANKSDTVRSVSLSRPSLFELVSTDCLGATIDSDTDCEIVIRWSPPAEGAFDETVDVEIVADSGSASLRYRATTLPPEAVDPNPVSGVDPEILVQDPPSTKADPPDSFGQEDSDGDGDQARRSGVDVSGQNRADSEDDQPNDASPDVSGRSRAGHNESG
jgi:hypothetical protein